jgi:radical SAM/Cys-rich protein
MEFKDRILSVQSEPLRSEGVRILQVNLGNRCNMACKHCHIEAGPSKNQVMDFDTIEAVLRVMREYNIGTLDVTGGSPELNPHFRYLVEEAREIGRHVIVRTNLTVFFEKGMGDLPDFYRDKGVEIIASLPYYTESAVDRVRGDGTFQKSVRALRKLNSLGYADGVSGRKLNLVYNPPGAFSPAPQQTLEKYYREELYRNFSVSFDNLYAFVNMPIGRFRDYLIRENTFEKYMAKLKNAFNPQTIGSLMCRHLLNIGWNGMLSDCDFNQAVGLNVHRDCPQHIGDFDYARLCEREISGGNHCYGCTAGQGST